VPSNTMGSIDWDKIWQEQMELTSFKGDGVDFWNKMAPRLNSSHSAEDNYTKEMLQRMALSPELSLCDVGCGTGSMTIPLAERVRRVTALDLSPAMLGYLVKSVLARGSTNIQIVNADFLTVDLSELGSFDIVLASRSLPMGNLRQALVRMNRLANKLCYLTWIARPRETDIMLCEILGVEYHPYPDYPIIANMLYTMGIHANIEIFTVASEQSYTSLDEAVNSSLRGQAVDSQGRRRLKTFLKERFTFKDGCWRRSFADRWALIWWRKEAEGK
jgi:ubiquinone/menaquinone biosynthesis C-methylase UbiE